MFVPVLWEPDAIPGELLVSNSLALTFSLDRPCRAGNCSSLDIIGLQPEASVEACCFHQNEKSKSLHNSAKSSPFECLYNFIMNVQINCIASCCFFHHSSHPLTPPLVLRSLAIIMRLMRINLTLNEALSLATYGLISECPHLADASS